RPDGHMDEKLRRDLRLSSSAAARARRIDDPAASAAGRARCDLSERDAALALGDGLLSAPAALLARRGRMSRSGAGAVVDSAPLQAAVAHRFLAAAQHPLEGNL